GDGLSAHQVGGGLSQHANVQGGFGRHGAVTSIVHPGVLSQRNPSRGWAAAEVGPKRPATNRRQSGHYSLYAPRVNSVAVLTFFFKLPGAPPAVTKRPRSARRR